MSFSNKPEPPNPKTSSKLTAEDVEWLRKRLESNGLTMESTMTPEYLEVLLRYMIGVRALLHRVLENCTTEGKHMRPDLDKIDEMIRKINGSLGLN